MNNDLLYLLMSWNDIIDIEVINKKYKMLHYTMKTHSY